MELPKDQKTKELDLQFIIITINNMAHTFTNYGLGVLTDGSVDFVNDTIKAMLLTSSHTTDIDAQEFIDDVSANEVSGPGYTAGGFTLGTKTKTVDDANDLVKYDCADQTYTTATITARYIAFYKDSGTPGTSPILSIEDLGADKASTAGNWVYTVNASGLYNVRQG